MKRLIIMLLLMLLPCAALAAPWVEEVAYNDAGNIEWRAVCFADELPPMLQAVVQQPTISGAGIGGNASGVGGGFSAPVLDVCSAANPAFP